MARPRNLTPSYLCHKATGQGRTSWTDAAGVRHERLHPGPHGSAASREAHARLCLEIASAPMGALAAGPDLSVAELLAAHLQHAEKHYRRPDGTLTHEVVEYKAVYKVMRELYGSTLAGQFSPLALKTLRTAMIQKGWCRTLVNQRIGRARRIFKWAAGEGLVPHTVFLALTVVTGLQRGRTTARESDPVRPADNEMVDRTIEELTPTVAAMVQLQRLTGMRAGELVSMRRCDLDMSGPIWLYTPAHHKLSYRGQARTVAIGARGQAILRPFFTPAATDYLFSPGRAAEEHIARRGELRQTPRYPSHMVRNALKRLGRPRRTPGDRYDVVAYDRAIRRACDRAYPPPAHLAQRPDESRKAWLARLTDAEKAELKAWRKSHRWHPHQLRHAHATEVRKVLGIEHAGAALGHSKMSATEVYAERDAGLAIEVARKLG